MSLFDRLVDEALKAQPNLATLRPVVEKELLHHDILREMSAGGFMKEMRRFLPATMVRETLEKASYWQYLTQLLEEEYARATATVS
ncbi:MAG: hypothetical protein WC003_15355 [Terrimicrobiaceae bacterium]